MRWVRGWTGVLCAACLLAACATVAAAQSAPAPDADAPPEAGADAGTPGEEPPGEEPPGEETRGEQTPGEQTPGEQTPGQEAPAGAADRRPDLEGVESDPPSAEAAADAPSTGLADAEAPSRIATSVDDAAEGPIHAGRIRYFLEAVRVRGNHTTNSRVVRRFVPIEPGEVLDVDDPAIETIRFRLLGTGWFDDVRLRLKRGSRRGWVVLVIEVTERNTLRIRELSLGVAQGVQRTTDASPQLVPWLGTSIAETNLFGRGLGLSLGLLASEPQQGARLRFTDPLAFGTPFLFSASAFASNAREFFGDDDALVSIICPVPEPGDTDPADCPPEVEAQNAVVFYHRFGASLGFGHDLGSSTWYRLDWQGELVDVSVRPEAASERRGDDVDPIDFAIDNGTSFVSLLKLHLTYDRRNDPALPSDGWLANFRGDLAAGILGSDYDFLRLRGMVRRWFPMPWSGHYTRLGLFGGILFGEAPFFYRFYAADLSDLIPARVLEMNIDHRAPPDLLNTAVAEMRAQRFAARVDVEYGLALYRGGSGLRAVHAYLGAGLYMLAELDDLRVAIPGYQGASRAPVDLTFDLGVRADTNVGVFQFGFSNLLGFVAL